MAFGVDGVAAQGAGASTDRGALKDAVGPNIPSEATAAAGGHSPVLQPSAMSAEGVQVRSRPASPPGSKNWALLSVNVSTGGLCAFDRRCRSCPSQSQMRVSGAASAPRSAPVQIPEILDRSRRNCLRHRSWAVPNAAVTLLAPFAACAAPLGRQRRRRGTLLGLPTAPGAAC